MNPEDVEANDRRQVRLGEEAKALMADGALIPQIFEGLEEQHRAAWLDPKLSPDDAERVRLSAIALNKIRQAIQSQITQGDTARNFLEEKRKNG